MKKYCLILIAFLLVLAVPLEAQMQHQPLARELEMSYYIPNNATPAVTIHAKAYAASQKDTSASVYIGGAGAVSFVVTALDTATLDFYIDYKLDGTNTSWAVGLTDSKINTGTTSNTGLSQEYIWRSHTVEKYGGLKYYIRTRAAFRASGQGVSSATYSEQIIFKQ